MTINYQTEIRNTKLSLLLFLNRKNYAQILEARVEERKQMRKRDAKRRYNNFGHKYIFLLKYYL